MSGFGADVPFPSPLLGNFLGGAPLLPCAAGLVPPLPDNENEAFTDDVPRFPGDFEVVSSQFA